MPVSFWGANHNVLGGGVNPLNGQQNNFSANYMADPDIAAQGNQAMKLQKQKQDFANARFNQVLPMIQGMGAGGGGVAAGQLAPAPTYGGGNVTAPHISGGPIWSEQAIRQNVNANNARVDQGTASNNMNMAGQLAGQGFGARSPLARALEQMGSQSAMGQKADYSRQFVQQAQQANRNFGLQADTANANAVNQTNQTNLGYGNLAQNQYSTLQNALNQQLAAAQSGLNSRNQIQGSLASALLGLVS